MTMTAERELVETRQQEDWGQLWYDVAEHRRRLASFSGSSGGIAPVERFLRGGGDRQVSPRVRQEFERTPLYRDDVIFGVEPGASKVVLMRDKAPALIVDLDVVGIALTGKKLELLPQAPRVKATTWSVPLPVVIGGSPLVLIPGEIRDEKFFPTPGKETIRGVVDELAGVFAEHLARICLARAFCLGYDREREIWNRATRTVDFRAQTGQAEGNLLDLQRILGTEENLDRGRVRVRELFLALSGQEEKKVPKKEDSWFVVARDDETPDPVTRVRAARLNSISGEGYLFSALFPTVQDELRKRVLRGGFALEEAERDAFVELGWPKQQLREACLKTWSARIKSLGPRLDLFFSVSANTGTKALGEARVGTISRNDSSGAISLTIGGWR